MAKDLPRKAHIAVSSYHGAIYPNGKRTGLVFTETLHLFEVLTVVAQANDKVLAPEFCLEKGRQAVAENQ